MPDTKNRALRVWKVVLHRVRRIETTWRGIPLSRQDHRTYTEAILLCAMVLSDLSNSVAGCGCYRQHVDWALNCASIDVADLASFLSDAIVDLRLSTLDISEGGSRNYNGFKGRLARKYPFAGKFLAPISGALAMHLANPSAATFYPPYQFLSFMTHLTLENIDMSQELEDEYVANEDRLEQHHYPSNFVKELNEIMKDWFSDFEVDDSFLPCHGPGGTAELPRNAGLYAKYGYLSPDPLLTYVFQKFGGLNAKSFVPLDLDVVTSRQSAIVFVPKSMKTKRVISKEPTTLLYFQKGVDSLIRKYIAKHSYLSKRIDLNDQGAQGSIAIEASRTRHHATVDLSAASDSVSYDLVKRVFHGTALYPFLVALRSTRTELPSGKVVALTKYAPMGSALCFPVETLLFACIVELTARYVHAVTGTLCTDYHVYGDDIIVRDSCLADLVVNLGWCAFRTNPLKTYGGESRFRESCGFDAYDGSIVTPMKIGRKFTAREVTISSPGVFAGLISMANTAAEYKFALLRLYLVDKLIHGTPFAPIFSRDGRYGLISVNPTNFHLPKRENRDYQVTEVRASFVTTIDSSTGPLIETNHTLACCPALHVDTEYIRYFEWLRRHRDRQHRPVRYVQKHWWLYDSSGDTLGPDTDTTVRIGSTVVKLTRQWRNEP